MLWLPGMAPLRALILVNCKAREDGKTKALESRVAIFWVGENEICASRGTGS